MKKISKGFWITLGIAAVFFMILIILSSVLELGERLSRISIYLEYTFYGISIILFVILFLRPLALIIFAPSFSLDDLFSEEENARKNFSMYKKVARNLLNEEYIKDEDKKAINDSMHDALVLKQSLSRIFDETIKKELNQMIITHAETVFISTAISQNGKLDAIAVISINLKLIKNLVLKCGFRPSYYSLGKLSVNVLSTAIIAETLEDMNFSEIFPNTGTNVLAEIPVLKTITGSFAQGIGNALLSLRVGIIARNYLFMNIKGMKKNQIRKLAFGEAVVLLPRVMVESMKKIPSRFKSIFSK